jgi:hypothetical protein
VNEQRRMAVVALVACAWALGSAVLGLAEAAAYLAPVVLLLALLATGRYPGERAYLRRISRVCSARPRRSAAPGRRRTRHIRLPRGGALLSAGLAGRGPPHAVR